MLKSIKYLIFILFLLFPFICLGANHFVRPGPNGGNYGSEDGTDWDNAYDGLPSSLTRGDTYYIAGGIYDMNGYEFNDTESGTDRITIKKANSNDCSGVTGWDPSFATTQAEFYNSNEPTYNRALYITNGYYTFDGVTGSGKNGYGFKVRIPSNIVDRNRLFLVDMSASEADDCIFKHIEFDGYTLERATEDQLNDQAFLFKISAGSDSGTIQYCYLHDFSQGIYISGDDCDNWTIENNYFYNAWGGGPASAHAEIINLIAADNIIFRYNIVEGNLSSTSITGAICAHGYLMVEYGPVDGLEIYDNLFFNFIGASLWLGTASGACSDEMNDWKVYNNTVIGGTAKIYVPQRTACTGDYTAYNGTYPATGWLVKNNLYYDTNSYIDGTGVTHEYNYYNSCTNVPTLGTGEIESVESVSALFQDYAFDVFSLKLGSEAIDSAVDLGASYNTDINGSTRPAPWDIGAYEYITGINNAKAKIRPLSGGINVKSLAGGGNWQ